MTWYYLSHSSSFTFTFSQDGCCCWCEEEIVFLSTLSHVYYTVQCLFYFLLSLSFPSLSNFLSLLFFSTALSDQSKFSTLCCACRRQPLDAQLRRTFPTASKWQLNFQLKLIGARGNELETSILYLSQLKMNPIFCIMSSVFSIGYNNSVNC